MSKFQNNFGIGYKTDHFLVFFGNKNLIHSNLSLEFNDIKFNTIKQTHSDIIVKSTSTEQIADAHYISDKHTALLIRTADCMPIMIYCKQTHRAAAVHAGWRGVENKIIEKTIKKLIDTGSFKKDFNFFVGPHITENSFEVEFDTFQVLTNSGYQLNLSNYYTTIKNKYYVNLNLILMSQIFNICGDVATVEFIDIDTFTNTEYHSYRYNSTKERNLSFICLLN